jgi:glycosyltransferase involved in cell wall biosynthesis
MLANASIYFALDAFSTNGAALMGRQAAGESFLTGFLKHSGHSAFHCYAAQQAEAQAFAAHVAQYSSTAEVKWAPSPAIGAVAETGCLFYPGPGIGKLAWQRRAVDQRSFSLCGITHTVSSERAMDELLGLMTAPMQEWDAVILTSVAVRDALTTLLQPYAEYLADRLGAKDFGLPQFPIIPLGIDTAAFARSDAHRAKWRNDLGIGSDDVVVLYMGRLSFHAKAHPFPMLAGVELAAKRTGKRVHLVQAGWFGHESIEKVFRKGAAEHAPSITTHFLDGRKPEVRNEIWSAADIFVSMSDNIQETFGLSPVEAMAAGLPCVVADWDGYKETVRDGIDGFRIPTMLPPAGLGQDLAQRFAAEIDDYDLYIGKASQLTFVDIDATAKAFELLLKDRDRRKAMGEAAQERARTVYDWSQIIPQYMNLWDQLAEKRKSASERAAKRANHEPNLTRPDPMRLFGHYSSMTFSMTSMVTWRSDTLESVWNDESAKLGLRVLATRQELERVCQRVRDAGCSRVDDLLSEFPSDRQGLIARSMLWLAKFGIISIA